MVKLLLKHYFPYPLRYFTIIIFLSDFLDAECDLSDEMPSESDEDEDDKPLLERDDEKLFEATWPWKTGSSPVPSFSVANPREGEPDNLAINSRDWRPIDFFFTMIPISFFDLVVDQSNIYASQQLRMDRRGGNAAWEDF